jgi:hypothetical protein
VRYEANEPQLRLPTLAVSKSRATAGTEGDDNNRDEWANNQSTKKESPLAHVEHLSGSSLTWQAEPNRSLVLRS